MSHTRSSCLDGYAYAQDFSQWQNAISFSFNLTFMLFRAYYHVVIGVLIWLPPHPPWLVQSKFNSQILFCSIFFLVTKHDFIVIQFSAYLIEFETFFQKVHGKNFLSDWLGKRKRQSFLACLLINLISFFIV